MGSTDLPVLHGVAYPAVDLVARFGVPSDQDSPDTRIVLLSAGDGRGHLRVSRVQGLEEVDRPRVLPLPSQFRGEEREWYRGILLLDEGIALIINLAWLLKGERFVRAQEAVSQHGTVVRLLDAQSGFATGRV
jgi:chemotaxis signal transduction protein